MAKLFATEASFETAHDALQVHGGIGYTKDLPIERFFSVARFMMIGWGNKRDYEVFGPERSISQDGTQAFLTLLGSLPQSYESL